MRSKWIYRGLLVMFFSTMAHLTVTAQEVTVSLQSAAAPASGAVSVAAILDSAPDTLGVLVLHLRFPTEKLSVMQVIPDSRLEDAGKTVQSNVLAEEVVVVIFGGNTPITTGSLCQFWCELSNSVSVEEQISFTDQNSSASTLSATSLSLKLNAQPISVIPSPDTHNADYNTDWHIRLSEALRMVQFFNLDAFHCDITTEDGFSPYTGTQDCTVHTADQNADWQLSLNELLRIIQFYNAFGYHPDATTEDGFAPGPF